MARSRTRQAFVAVAAVVWALAAAAAYGETQGARGRDEGREQQEVRRLRDAGEILPLERLVDDARRLHPGRVLETELQHRDVRRVYEIEILDDRGVVWELVYDARTGELLRSEQED